MKIKIIQEIEVPEDFYCKFNPTCQCEGLTLESNYHCDIYGEKLQTNRCGPIKCQKCVDASYAAVKGE